MQSNNNYANTLDPDLRGSVDFDFFSNDEGKEEIPKDNLSVIDEGDRASQSSGENSFNTASIGELGGRWASAQPASAPKASPSPPPSRASSGKSASTIRSGGFPPMPRGDSARPCSPTPPSSHASPSPHLLRSPAAPERPRSAARPASRSASLGSRRRGASPQDSDRSASSRDSSRSASSRDSSRSASSRDSRSASSRGSRSASSRDSLNVSLRNFDRSAFPAESKGSVRRASPPASDSTRRSSSRSSSDLRSSARRSRSDSLPSSRPRTPSICSSASSPSSRTASPKGRSPVSSSESDVTDVSPLSSKNASPLGSPTGARKLAPSGGPTHHHKDQVQFRAGREEQEEQLNVELIMKAILELDRERQGRSAGSSPGSVSSKRSASSERAGKKNFSFAPQRCRQIEKENKRLLDSLLGQSGRRRASTGAVLAAPPRPYHSTINRLREQRRIEEENLQILRRLERVRPSPDMSREQQLRDYRRQTHYGAVLPGGRKSAKGRQRPAELPESEQGESRPASRQSAASAASARPLRPKPASSRPDWPSGW